MFASVSLRSEEETRDGSPSESMNASYLLESFADSGAASECDSRVSSAALLETRPLSSGYRTDTVTLLLEIFAFDTTMRFFVFRSVADVGRSLPISLLSSKSPIARFP